MMRWVIINAIIEPTGLIHESRSISTLRARPTGMVFAIIHTRKRIYTTMVLRKTISLVKMLTRKSEYTVCSDSTFQTYTKSMLTVGRSSIKANSFPWGAIDWYSYVQREGIPHAPFKNQSIPLSDLLQISKEKGLQFRQGDILLIRTGWTAAYHQLTEEEKEALGGRDDRASCGVEATEETIRWHWEQGFAAVASDTVAYEAWPSSKPWGVSIHEVIFSPEFSRLSSKSDC